MSLGKSLSDKFPSVINIKRIGKNMIVINFKFSFDTNEFVQINNILSKNWLFYISN